MPDNLIQHHFNRPAEDISKKAAAPLYPAEVAKALKRTQGQLQHTKRRDLVYIALDCLQEIYFAPGIGEEIEQNLPQIAEIIDQVEALRLTDKYQVDVAPTYQLEHTLNLTTQFFQMLDDHLTDTANYENLLEPGRIRAERLTSRAREFFDMVQKARSAKAIDHENCKTYQFYKIDPHITAGFFAEYLLVLVPEIEMIEKKQAILERRDPKLKTLEIIEPYCSQLRRKFTGAAEDETGDKKPNIGELKDIMSFLTHGTTVTKHVWENITLTERHETLLESVHELMLTYDWEQFIVEPLSHPEKGRDQFGYPTNPSPK
jgi:hypothetical protein